VIGEAFFTARPALLFVTPHRSRHTGAMRGDRPSDTAVLIGRCTLLAARDPVRRPLVPSGAEIPLSLLLAGHGPWFDFALRHDWTRASLGLLERLALPGIITHYLTRKRWIEDQARQALQRGVTQVVVLGAGFDTLAWRLHRQQPAVHFFELDHPATQSAKRRELVPAGNLTFLPADLSLDSPGAILRACPAFSTDQPTLFIAEGLLMYFPEKEVAALLRNLAKLTTRRPVEFIFSFMAQAPDGSISFRNGSPFIDRWLRWRREPFRWGIARTALPGFLQECGLRIATVADHDDLRAQILAPLDLAGLDLARGECLCHCTAA
jgi:methyltransferase (TIGR00027 family)